MFVQRVRDYLNDIGIELHDRRQALAVAIVAALVVLAGVCLYGRTRPAPIVVRATAAAPRASPASMPARETTIAVHVAGAVRRPGMVILTRSARVDDAVRAVGGPLAGADLDRINLAAKLADGQQIRVPRRGESAPDAGSTSAAGVQAPGVAAENGGAAAGGPPTGPIDINSATAAQLDGLPGIGPVLAQRLFQYRTEHGGFRRVEDLQQVEGIGPKKFAQLRSAVVCRP